MNNIIKVNQFVPYDLRKRNVLQSRNTSSVRYAMKIYILHSSKYMVTCSRNNKKF